MLIKDPVKIKEIWMAQLQEMSKEDIQAMDRMFNVPIKSSVECVDDPVDREADDHGGV